MKIIDINKLKEKVKDKSYIDWRTIGRSFLIVSTTLILLVSALALLGFLLYYGLSLAIR